MPNQTLHSATRAATFVPSSFNADERTVELTWTTGAEVRRESWFDGPFIEKLETGADNVRLERLNQGAALLDSHQSGSLSAVLGVVERAWLEGGVGRAKVRFSSRADVEGIVADVRDGIVRNVSVGYQIHQTQRDEGSNPPVIRVMDWEPHELSLVPVPADAGCQVRSEAEQTTPTHREMTTNPTQAGADSASNDVQTAAAEPSAVELRSIQEDAKRARLEAAMTRAAMQSGYPDDKLDGLLRECRTMEDCTFRLLAHMKEQQAARAVPPADAPLTVTRAEGSDLVQRLGEALAYRVAPVGAPSDAAREFRGASLLDMARACLEKSGTSTLGLSKRELVKRAFHVSSDFSDLFTSTAERSLMDGYEEEPHQWSEFCYRRDFPDFRETKGVLLSASLVPSALLEGGEYKAGTMRTDSMTAQLSTYGRKVLITREMVINDDLSALSEVVPKLGRGCRLLEHNSVLSLITGNALAGIDGVALYDASHSNTADVAIGTPAIAKATELMRKQTDPAGERINLEPSFILCSAAQELAVTQLMNPIGYAPAAAVGASGPNIYAGRYRVIVDPRLDAVDPDLLHFIASPNRIPTIRYGFLEGESGPAIDTLETRDPDGLTLLCRHDFGVSLSDFRGFARINLSA